MMETHYTALKLYSGSSMFRNKTVLCCIAADLALETINTVNSINEKYRLNSGKTNRNKGKSTKLEIIIPNEKL